MSLPLVTLGITCFNAADTVRRAVLSATSQDWPNKEIIIVDDRSSDGSDDIIESLINEYPNIKTFRHAENKGYAGALNTIVNMAKGDFIAILDDDDCSVPERTRTQLRRITDYEQSNQCDLVLCYSNRRVIKAGRPEHIAQAIGRHALEPHGLAVADYIFGIACDPRFIWGMFGSCTLMARRQTLLRVGPFDETFRRCAEWDMAIRAAFCGAHFIAVDEPLVTQHKTSGADKAGNVALTYALQLRTKYKEYLAGRSLYRSSRAMAYCNYYGAKGLNWRSWGYLILACLASPTLLVRKLSARA